MEKDTILKKSEEKQVNIQLPDDVLDDLEILEKTPELDYKTKNQWIRELIINEVRKFRQLKLV